MKLHILILTLPTQQATLRMRVWRALKNTGAAMLRDGVYLLPEAQQGQEIFNDISREIRDEGVRLLFLTLQRPKKRKSARYLIALSSTWPCWKGYRCVKTTWMRKPPSAS
ncbi:Chromate resistance protein ChrB [Cronobacter sakazakii]|uniref:Chromate resistance protein ChrB n=1 Tax=Cronobacter sakazakii TaxID=28141 RepID=UPI0003A2A5B7|nr:Chromate resistance protein ChrB [Cronobacter sakazakii]